MSTKNALLTLSTALVTLLSACATPPATKLPHLAPSAELQWAPLNPKEPGSGELSLIFGDLKERAPVAFLLRFPGGLKEPFHLHSSDYYAVEIAGVQHDWAPGADEGPSLPAGSWWFQPGEAAHANHCEPGAECTVFVYMPRGFDFRLAE
ncbi:MAG: DUF4437 domain-containing protein [Myxococcota bacterium]